MRKLKLTSAFLVGLTFLVLTSCEEKQATSNSSSNRLTSIEDSMNYIVGSGMAKVFSLDNESDIRPAAIDAAVLDFMDGKEFRFTEEVGGELLKRYLKSKELLQNEDVVKKGEKFLKENALRPEVKVLDRGLQYEVLKSGKEGALSPDGNDVVKVRFSQGSPSKGITWTQEMATNPRDTIQMALNREVSGFSQACQYMKVGDKWKVWLPHEIGSSEGTPSPAAVGQRFDVIYMEIELLGIVERGYHNIPNTKEFSGYPGGYYKDESKRIIYQPGR